jgi:hypothetical protein
MNRILGIMVALTTLATVLKAQAPTNLKAQTPASLQPHVMLTWNAPAGASFFKIYRSSPDSTAFQLIGISSFAQQYDDNSVSAGVLYYYAVSAVMLKDTVLVESPRSTTVAVRVYSLAPGPKGIIAGRITDQVFGTPVPRAVVRFYKLPSPTNRGVDIATDASGGYTAVVDTGTYIIRAEEAPAATIQGGHQPQWFDHAIDPGGAKPVVVRADDTVHVSFALLPNFAQQFAYVSGTVTDEQGAPLSGAAVAFVRPIQELVASGATTSLTPGTGAEARDIPGIGFGRGVAWMGFTNTSGKFFAQVPANRQYVALAAQDGYYPEAFNNIADLTQATLIAVRGDTSGINFSLRKKTATDTGSMQGAVQDGDGNDVPSRIILFPRPKEGGDRPAIFTFTDSSGVFLLNDIESGSYAVLAVPFSNYAPSFATASGVPALSWLTADSVKVNGTTPHVSIAVPSLQNTGLTRINGRVQSAANTPLPGVRVLAQASNGNILGYGLSDPAGNYSIEALGNGPVTLLADRFSFNQVQAPLTIPVNTFAVNNMDFTLSTSYPTSVASGNTLPQRCALDQNYPNPFNPTTKIGFRVSGAGSAWVRLSVYDILGREVAVLVNEEKQPGSYEVSFDGHGLASGIYLYKLVGGAFAQTHTMMLVK